MQPQNLMMAEVRAILATYACIESFKELIMQLSFSTNQSYMYQVEISFFPDGAIISNSEALVALKTLKREDCSVSAAALLVLDQL